MANPGARLAVGEASLATRMDVIMSAPGFVSPGTGFAGTSGIRFAAARAGPLAAGGRPATVWRLTLAVAFCMLGGPASTVLHGKYAGIERCSRGCDGRMAWS